MATIRLMQKEATGQIDADLDYAKEIRSNEQFAQRGYRVWMGRARMVLEGTDRSPTLDRCVNLARWAM